MAEPSSPSLFDQSSPGAGGGGQAGSAAPAGPFADSQFSDGKAEGALRTIGEVAKGLGIRQHVLRYWEEQFPMLRPLKRSGSRRYYRPADIALVQRIDQLVHKEGYTLRGARLVLQGRGAEAAGERAAAPVAAPATTGAPAATSPPAPAVLDRLKQIRARLAEAAR